MTNKNETPQNNTAENDTSHDWKHKSLEEIAQEGKLRELFPGELPRIF